MCVKNISVLVCLLALFACSKKQNAFDDVEFVSNYDGDTITVNLKGLPDVFGKKLKVRLKGIDTPEIHGKCETEIEMAKQARDVVHNILAHAQHISLKNVSRGKYFRLVAVVEADSLNVNQYLLDLGLARKFKRKRHGWCNLP